jgi:hypothetical protein
MAYFTYSFYEKKLQEGEVWIRNSNGLVQTASEALSGVIEKYKSLTPDTFLFYNQIMSGQQILRLDMIQDVIFIETREGNIFDKIVYRNNQILAANQDNNFYKSLSANRTGFPDYWFDESNKKIYTSFHRVDYHLNNQITIGVVMEQFDMITNIFDTKLYFTLDFTFDDISYGTRVPFIEPTKLCYNKATKDFNISYIQRGPLKDFGLVSINILKDQKLEVKAINTLLPYTKNVQIDLNVIEEKLLTVNSDYY